MSPCPCHEQGYNGAHLNPASPTEDGERERANGELVAAGGGGAPPGPTALSWRREYTPQMCSLPSPSFSMQGGRVILAWFHPLQEKSWASNSGGSVCVSHSQVLAP